MKVDVDNNLINNAYRIMEEKEQLINSIYKTYIITGVILIIVTLFFLGIGFTILSIISLLMMYYMTYGLKLTYYKIYKGNDANISNLIEETIKNFYKIVKITFLKICFKFLPIIMLIAMFFFILIMFAGYSNERAWGHTADDGTTEPMVFIAIIAIPIFFTILLENRKYVFAPILMMYNNNMKLKEASRISKAMYSQGKENFKDFNNSFCNNRQHEFKKSTYDIFSYFVYVENWMIHYNQSEII